VTMQEVNEALRREFEGVFGAVRKEAA
jgi:hypothetical protein